jgi:hypothetical protein
MNRNIMAFPTPSSRCSEWLARGNAALGRNDAGQARELAAALL